MALLALPVKEMVLVLGVEGTELVGVAAPLVVAVLLTVALWKEGMEVVLATAGLVGRAQVWQATLVATVMGMTAVQGQSVIVRVVASVMVEVSEPCVITVGLGQKVVRAVNTVVV